MSVLKSQISPRSDEYRANADRMKGLVEDLKKKIETASQGGDAAARDRHISRGKMLPRERVNKLLTVMIAKRRGYTPAGKA